MKEYIATFAKEGSRNHGISGTEIIRCKDCWWYKNEGCMRAEGLMEATPEDFCSYGCKGDEYETK